MTQQDVTISSFFFYIFLSDAGQSLSRIFWYFGVPYASSKALLATCAACPPCVWPLATPWGPCLVSCSRDSFHLSTSLSLMVLWVSQASQRRSVIHKCLHISWNCSDGARTKFVGSQMIPERKRDGFRVGLRDKSQAFTRMWVGVCVFISLKSDMPV